ncbi:unnamed protein product [Somion occarium]|uniref:MYND-type domain-containing protein n=1 Tax=Somion occarium TaxID=3059160 RepID=A0ABP1CPE7_9APHY
MSLQESGSGGLVVTEELQNLLQRPGYIRTSAGGQRIRDIYVTLSAKFNARLLNPFAQACYWGNLEVVIRAVELGQAPDLTSAETPFKFGYATLVVAGAQRTVLAPGGMRHTDTLKYLLNKGCPPDVEDIVGYTALHHATQKMYQPELARLLLENGANVNHRNRYGEVPIFGCFQTEIIGAIELLMEFGTDLDTPDAQGLTPAKFFLQCGPRVTAAVTKWLRKRRGEEAPLDEKKCNSCGKADTSLKQCAKCHAARYCSTECQRRHWPTHKLTCRPFSTENTVILKPIYRDAPGATLMSPSDLTRKALGMETQPRPARNSRFSHAPSTFPKSMVIKVQVPYGFGTSAESSKGDLLIYTKKRDFVCMVQWTDEPQAYDRISHVVRTKGVGGAKAYFPAELRSADVLVVKVDEVLAEQPF